MDKRRCILLLILLVAASSTWARKVDPPGNLPENAIYLDVVATTKSGSPVAGLQKQDFAIFDNKAPQAISSFQAMDGTQEPVEVIIVIDAVNAPYHEVSYERDQIDKFFRADRGQLTFPTALYVLMDSGLQPVNGLSKDGNRLAGSLDEFTVSVSFLHRSAGYYGAADRYQLGLVTLHQLARREASFRGRKLMIWISPGWPLLAGPSVLLDNHERRLIFENIVDFSTELRRDRVTLYAVDPEGAADSVADDVYWQAFAKGISKPASAQMANLGLEVLSMQSGGAVLSFNNNITSLLQRCIADARAYYQLSFDPPAGAQPNQYHRVEVRIAKRGLKARTLKGYYSGVASQWHPLAPPPVATGTRGAGPR
jgi:VWFA-related protein